MKILVIAEHDNTSLKGSTNSTIAAAKEISSDISVLVAGHSCSSVSDEAACLDGVTSVMLADSSTYENFLAEDIANLIVSISDDFEYILAPATTFGKNFLPRVAAILDSQQISEITEVVSADTFNESVDEISVTEAWDSPLVTPSNAVDLTEIIFFGSSVLTVATQLPA